MMWNKKLNLYKIPDIVNQLFSHLASERIDSFSCGHIIPSSNLQTLVVSKGPCGGVLEYKAGKHSDLTVVCVSLVSKFNPVSPPADW